MARTGYVWAIDIGRCGLKALRARRSDDPRKLMVDAVESIEYPMILTQPEADPVELVRQALLEFKNRQPLRGDKVAVAVPGQAGLSKFIKLPPIEAKKIPDIVRYEARQQIPFPLEQVVWDWQRLAGGVEEGGFVIDAEVAMFAMKREQVYKALAPLTEAGIEVDVLQLSPVALANMLVFDQLPDPATADPMNPPASIVLVSSGVDTTDIVVTNGFRIWQRSMPIGGNAFTKALVQGMKLTFAKAEHIKRNAVKAEDPKLVFKVMRPVFTEFASELQRSLNYFTGTDRNAKIGKVYLLGNAVKLRGLSDFVSKQLQLDVQRLESFRGLEGPGVNSPAFRENKLAFGTTYGLAVQAVGDATIRTNLLPPAILRDRLVESKKPATALTLVGLLIGGLLGFAGTYSAWTTYADNLYRNAFSKADAVVGRSQKVVGEVDTAKGARDAAIAEQQIFVDAMDRRFQAIDLMRAINDLLPRDNPGKIPANPADRNEIHIDGIDCEWYPDLAVWFTSVKEKWDETHPNSEEEVASTPPAAEGAPQPQVGPDGEPLPAAEGDAAAPGAPETPSGPGWVIQIVGHHFHNEPHHQGHDGPQFVRETLIRNLLGEGDEVTVAAGPLAGKTVPVKELGIGFPVIVDASNPRPVRVQRPGAGEKPAAGGPGAGPGQDDDVEEVKLRRYDFTVQFCWQPTVPGSDKPKPVAQPNAAPAAAENW
jgi:type IV pilus assembly protein PilM